MYEIWSAEMVGVIALGAEPPAPNDFIVFEGMAMRIYPFVCEHRKFSVKIFDDDALKNVEQAELYNRKDELEKKLESNYRNCRDLFGHIKTNINLWLSGKTGKVFFLNEESVKKILWFARSVNAVLGGIFPNGAERERLIAMLEKEDLCRGQVTLKREFDKSIFEDLKRNNPGILPLIDTNFDQEIELDMQKLLDYIGTLLDKLESVISESVDVYYEYVDAHAKLYNLDRGTFIDLILNSREDMAARE